jgi:hypothetical protein
MRERSTRQRGLSDGLLRDALFLDDVFACNDENGIRTALQQPSTPLRIMLGAMLVLDGPSLYFWLSSNACS